MDEALAAIKDADYSNEGVMGNYLSILGQQRNSIGARSNFPDAYKDTYGRRGQSVYNNYYPNGQQDTPLVDVNGNPVDLNALNNISTSLKKDPDITSDISEPGIQVEGSSAPGSLKWDSTEEVYDSPYKGYTPDYNNIARSIANNAGMLYSLSQKPESVEEIKNRRAGKFDEILSKYRGLISKREPYDDRIGRREAVKSARAFEKQALKTPSGQAARMGRKFVGKGLADAMTTADMAESQYKRGQDIQEAQMLMPLAQAELQAGEAQAAREYRAEAEELGAKSKYTDVVSGRLADTSMLADVRAKEKNIADMNAAQADFLYRTYGIRV
jgi:hypothetical protein